MLIDELMPRKLLPDGREAMLYPLLCGGGRIGAGVPCSQAFDDVWDYALLADAVAAFAAWDGAGEPAGWVRHKPSNRRRPGGDASQEYVLP